MEALPPFSTPFSTYQENLTLTPHNSSSTEEGILDPCAYQPPQYLEERFWLVSVFGTSIAVVSIIENVFLFCVFASSKQHRNSHSFYLLLLAFCDVFIALAYIPLMSFSLLLDYYESLWLLKAWFAYMIPMITVSHVAISASSFLIVAASFERYCITVNSKKVRNLNKYRKQIGVGAIFFGCFTKISLPLEFKIEKNLDCVNTMAEYSLSLSDFAMNRTYNLVWRLWFRSIVTVLLPFFLLSFINARIVIVLQKYDFARLLHVDKISEVQRKSRVRAATRTLLLLVFTYLLSNVLNVIFTIWEYIDIKSLSGPFFPLYTFGVDSISIATCLAGALRLPIYMTCQPTMLTEFREFCKNIVSKEHFKPELSSSTSDSPYAPMLVKITDLLLKYPQTIKEKISLTKKTDSGHEPEEFCEVLEFYNSELNGDEIDAKIFVEKDNCEVFL